MNAKVDGNGKLRKGRQRRESEMLRATPNGIHKTKYDGQCSRQVDGAWVAQAGNDPWSLQSN